MPVQFLFPRREDYSEEGWSVFIHMNIFYLLVVRVVYGDDGDIADIERLCRRRAMVDGAIVMEEFLGLFYLAMSFHDFELHRLLRRTASLMMETNE